MIKLLLIILGLGMLFIIWCMLRMASIADNEMMLMNEEVKKVRNK